LKDFFIQLSAPQRNKTCFFLSLLTQPKIQPTMNPNDNTPDRWSGIYEAFHKGYFKAATGLGNETVAVTAAFPGVALVDHNGVVHGMMMFITGRETKSSWTSTEVTTRMTLNDITEEVHLKTALFNFTDKMKIRFRLNGAGQDDLVRLVVTPRRGVKLLGTSDTGRATPIVLNNSGLRSNAPSEVAQMPKNNKDLTLTICAQGAPPTRLVELLKPFKADGVLTINNPDYVPPAPKPKPREVFRCTVSRGPAQFECFSAESAGGTAFEGEHECDGGSGSEMDEDEVDGPPAVLRCTVGKGEKDSVQGGNFSSCYFYPDYTSRSYKLIFEVIQGDEYKPIVLMPSGTMFRCPHKTHRIDQGRIYDAVRKMDCRCNKGNLAYIMRELETAVFAAAQKHEGGVSEGA